MTLWPNRAGWMMGNSFSCLKADDFPDTFHLHSLYGFANKLLKRLGPNTSVGSYHIFLYHQISPRTVKQNQVLYEDTN